jgi:hypothetical protein
MDYSTLLANLPSAAEKELYVREAGDSEERFQSLLELALCDKDPVAWRAAWIADGSDEQHPGLASGSISRIVRRLSEIDSAGTLRSLLRMLSRYDIGEKDQGMLIDLCFGYMVSGLYPVAVKVHAMQIIYNHVLIYPELKDELVTVIMDQESNNSVGFRARGMRIIRKLEGARGSGPG